MQEREPATRAEAKYVLLDRITPDEWTNYGDVNPGPHGGMWCRYDSNREVFHGVTTFQAAEVGFDTDPEDYGDQYVWEVRLGWRDLLTEEGDLSDDLHGIVDSLSGHTAEVMAIWADDIDLRYYVADVAREVGGGGRRVEGSDYLDVIQSVGVDVDESDL